MDHDRLSRRSFIKTSGLIGTGVMAFPQLLLGQGSKKNTIIYSTEFLKHKTGLDSHEQPDRVKVIIKELVDRNMVEPDTWLTPVLPLAEYVEAVHYKNYIDKIRTEVNTGVKSLSSEPNNTFVCKDSFRAALFSAGSMLVGVDQVMKMGRKHAFAVNRPPGHHATPNKAMGYCLLNNAAIGTRYAQQVHGVEKVLIFDFDVHHGNGTQEIFYEDGSVFVCSIHQDGLYPMPQTKLGKKDETGKGRGKDTNLNIPLPKGIKDKRYLAAVQKRFLPAAREFKPDLIIISAGFDCLDGDPQGRFKLTNTGIARMSRLTADLADECCQGRTVTCLEGGYNMRKLGPAYAAHIEGMVA